MSDIPAELTRDDLVRVITRDRFVKEQQAQRIAQLVTENLEFAAIIRELQSDLAEQRERNAPVNDPVANNGDEIVSSVMT